MTRTLKCRLLCTALIAFTPMVLHAADIPAKPELLGEIVVPSGLSLEGITFGGISDLSYDVGRDVFYAISDDRIEYGPARYYELRLTPKEGVLRLDIAAMKGLLDETGRTFQNKGADPEGIAFDAASSRLFWSSERDTDDIPAIYRRSADGSIAKVALPEAYLPLGENKGIYNNQGFEGLDLSADGKTLFAMIESGLAQDGAKASLEAGSPARMMLIDTESLEPTREYFYVSEPIFAAPTQDPFWKDNGVSAIEALDDGRFVIVERAFSLGIGNQIRFFIADPKDATDITGKGIDGATPMSKTLWFEIAEGDYGLDIDNIESFEFGPEINDRRSFVIASDDNFNPERQFTQFVMFTIPAK